MEKSVEKCRDFLIMTSYITEAMFNKEFIVLNWENRSLELVRSLTRLEL